MWTPGAATPTCSSGYPPNTCATEADSTALEGWSTARVSAGGRRRGSARSRGSTSFVDPGHSEQVPALIGLLLTVEGPFAWGKQPPGEDLGAPRLNRYSDDRMPLPHLSLEAVDGDGPAAVFARHESMTNGAIFSVKQADLVRMAWRLQATSTAGRVSAERGWEAKDKS